MDKGHPFPKVEMAMFTPSAVWAYWMRGSMAGILYASGLSVSRSASGGCGRDTLFRDGAVFWEKTFL